MAARSFTVFQDTPSSGDAVIVSKPVRASSRVLARSATKSSTTSNHLPGTLNELAVAIDKENFNPLTGLRSSATASKGEKLKRKTTSQAQSVLAPKALPTSIKKLKADAGGNGTTEPETKKRRTLTASTTASRAKAKAITRKEGSGLGSTKAPATSSTQGRKTKRTTSSLPMRKVPSPLPKVDEEDGFVVATGTSESAPKPLARTLSQATIDSRCYELTVSPLADVSEAYEVHPLSPGPAEDTKPTPSKSQPEQDIFRTVREPSAEPELRDYFTVDNLNAVFASSTSRGCSVRPSEEPEEKQPASSLFSTPERQKLYMSFTFSSPSPSGKRFRDTYGSYSSKQGSPTRLTAKAAGILSPVAESPVSVARRVQ